MNKLDNIFRPEEVCLTIFRTVLICKIIKYIENNTQLNTSIRKEPYFLKHFALILLL